MNSPALPTGAQSVVRESEERKEARGRHTEEAPDPPPRKGREGCLAEGAQRLSSWLFGGRGCGWFGARSSTDTKEQGPCLRVRMKAGAQ